MKFRTGFMAMFFAFTLGLTACGGGGSDDNNNGFTGPTGPAPITADNEDELALAAASGLRIVLTQETIPSGLPGSRPASRTGLARLASRTASEPVAGVCDSGSVDVTQEGSGGTAGTVTIVYNQCAISDYYGSVYETVTIDGTAIFVSREDGSFSLTIQNMTVTSSSYGTETIANYTMECDADFNCTWTVDAQGLDGRTYRVTESDVYASGGFASGSLTVYDPDYGEVSVTVNDVAYDVCESGVPGGGSIVIQGAGGETVTVTFIDCDSFTVSDDSSSRTYQWADILGG